MRTGAGFLGNGARAVRSAFGRVHLRGPTNDFLAAAPDSPRAPSGDTNPRFLVLASIANLQHLPESQVLQQSDLRPGIMTLSATWILPRRFPAATVL